MRSVLSLCVLFVPAAMGAPPEGDVYLHVDSGRVTTGLISEDGTDIQPGVRVFYGELGVDVPNTANDPGFQAEPGEFAVPGLVGLNVRRALRAWNGADFSTIPLEQISITLGPASVTTPTTDVFTPGFAVPVSPDGSWHHHPTFELLNPASDGIYLLELEVYGEGYATSEPIWMLWGQNADEAQADAAYEYAASHIPAPGWAGLLLAGAVAYPRRRR